jgi:16S rRNA (uracil1498-N3)-methyltransferase
LFLTGGEAHHAVDVLRLKRDERATVLDGQGTELLCLVEGFARDKVRLNVIERRFIAPLPWQITLLQALPKGKLFEAIIQKATELGVFRIVPLLSERVVSQLDEKQAGQKLIKWQLTALEAIKQCGSAWLPRIEPACTPGQFVQRRESFDLPTVASLASSKHPRDYFEAFTTRQGRKPGSLCVWVGPEGDFSPAELEMIIGSGALPMTLGRLVLRTETAAVYCLSILNYECSYGIASTERV